MRRGLAVLALLALTACGQPGPAQPTAPPTGAAPPTTAAPTPAPTVTATPEPSITACADVIAALTPEQRVGQLFMLGASTAGLDPASRDAITTYGVGSVVLLGNSEAGAEAIAGVTASISALAERDLPILVAVDQEGGRVQRLRGPGFSDIPPATEQAALGPDLLELQAADWGTELVEVGIHYDLAPVADVVPADKQRSNAPIGALQRNYGNDAQTTADAVVAFVTGMREAGVATALKHFPGLGQVTHNTDFDVAVDDDVVPDDPDWLPFIAGIEAGAASVMVSSGVFTKLDDSGEAVFSERIITGILREELGFDGVVIADDLGAAASVADVPPGERAVRFITAGGDLVINADPALLPEMVGATLAEIETDPRFAEQVDAAAARVLALKAGVGLVECG